jgi:hypothetical protein
MDTLKAKVKADYVVTALKGKNAKKDEKKQILITKNDAIVEEIEDFLRRF